MESILPRDGDRFRCRVDDEPWQIHRSIDDRLFVPHCAIIDSAIGLELPAGMLLTELARR